VIFATVGAEIPIFFSRGWDRDNWVSLHVLEDSQHRRRRSSKGLDLLLVFVE